MDRENLGEVLGTVGGKVSQTLKEILSQFESPVAEPAKTDATPDDPNPFLALFGLEDHQPGREGHATNGAAHVSWWSIKAETDVESVIRSQAILDARRRCLEFYNRCKHRLNMPCS